MGFVNPPTTGGNIVGVVGPANGGTGVANNAASTQTISGNFGLTWTVTATTSLTLPTSGTVTALGNTTTGSGTILVLSASPTFTGTLTAATITASGNISASTTGNFFGTGSDQINSLGGQWNFTPGGTVLVSLGSNTMVLDGTTLAFNSATGSHASGDVGISRTAASTLAIGNGTASDSSGTLKLATVASTLSPSTGWAFDAHGATISVTNGGNTALADGSGLILVTNSSNGDTALYLGGGGTAVLVSSTLSTWVAPTTSPAAGKMSVSQSGGAYTVYNNYGSTVTVAVGLLQTRTTH